MGPVWLLVPALSVCNGTPQPCHAGGPLSPFIQHVAGLLGLSHLVAPSPRGGQPPMLVQPVVVHGSI